MMENKDVNRLKVESAEQNVPINVCLNILRSTLPKSRYDVHFAVINDLTND